MSHRHTTPIPALAALISFIAAAPLSGQWLETALVWHDNVTNGEAASDRIEAVQWRTEVSANLLNVPVAGGHRWLLAAGGRVEIWPRFEDLDAATVWAAGTWEWKAGLGPHRPVLGATAEGEGALARESARGGLGAAARLHVRQRIGSAWMAHVSHEWRRFDARGLAFDRTAREFRARLVWQPAERWTLALDGFRRTGTVVSYSRPPRPDLEALGKPVTLVDTFEQDTPWIAYYFDASTRGGGVEAGRHWGRHSLTLRHELRRTLHVGPGYRNTITILRYGREF